MIDISTSINTALDRAISGIMPAVAKEGLKELKKILDTSGFSQSIFLKNYSLDSHVLNKGVSFEITIDTEAIISSVEDEREAERKSLRDEVNSIKKALQTFSAKGSRVVQTSGGLSGTVKTSGDRLTARLSFTNPRSARVLPDGKLLVNLKRAIDEIEDQRGKFKYPKEGYDGVIKEFQEELSKILIEKFVPEFRKIVKRELS